MNGIKILKIDIYIYVYISLFFPNNNYCIFNTGRFNREKSRYIKIVLWYSSNFSCHFFFWSKKSIWIESFTFRDTSMSVPWGGGKNKNRRPIESGAINGSRHCSPRFQVKFTRIKNGAIVYRNSLFVFSRSTRYIRKIVSAFLLIDIQSPFYISIIGRLQIQSFEF